MRIPLRWLSEYVVPNVSINELARRLTVAGVEVAEIISAGEWENVTVGYVQKIDPHPDPEVTRIRLATVETVDGVMQVVCGAPNVAAGQKIAYASIGAKLIDGHTGKPTTLKKAKIRGVESQGMICSEKELGLSDAHEGILVLPEDAKVGTPLADILGDTILDVEITPNRPDWLSILGVAREAAAVTQQKWTDPPTDYPTDGSAARHMIDVEIADPDLCPRYVAAIIRNVTVGESPQWMKDRLVAVGMRPINNVVDITNYVMLELGQPLHAFDYDKVRGKKIIVRRARPAEKLRLLTETEDRALSDDMLVIADGEGATGVAGVMGGGDSEVSASTKTILLEAANFKGTSIRRTGQALKLRTDASTRFEKGLPPDLPPVASARAVRLMVELCGGQAASSVVDIYPGKMEVPPITLTTQRLTRVLGIEVPPAQVQAILGSLGFECVVKGGDYVVFVPYWRTDVNIADDVIEEVARIIGYDELPTTQLGGRIPTWVPQPLPELRERVKDVMAGAGMQEVITYSMSDIDALTKVLPREELAIHAPLKLANPLSRQYEYARTTLRHSLLETLADNIRGSGELIALFETARVYQPREDDLPHEIESLCGVVSGRAPDRWGLPRGEQAGFFDAKARLEHLFEALHVAATYREAHDFAYLPGRTAEVVVGETVVGLVGEVHPRVAKEFDIDDAVAMFEVDLEALLPHVPEVIRYEGVSQYPAVQEDLALVVEDAVSAAQVMRLISGFPLVKSVRAFDVYTGDPIPAGKKSLAFAITYQSEDKTLTDADVAKQRGRIIERLRRELRAEPRA